MSEAGRMVELYNSVYEGDSAGEAWHGPSLKPLLKDVTAEQASGTSNLGTHSILQLVSHITYWEEIVLRRFNGEVVDAPLNTPEDWPGNHELNDAEWHAILGRLEKSHDAMQKAMSGCSDEKLRQGVPERNHDYYTLLHGIIDHCVYHSAQIALVKKAVRHNLLSKR
jgi:uncharacterized damage-inducible protein DinB